MKRNFVILGVSLIGLAAIASVGLVFLTSPESETVQAGSGPFDLSQGERIYEAQCASCHGVNLEGAPNWRVANADGTMPPPPHNETGHTWHHDMQMLFDYTKFGGEEALRRRGIPNVKSGMPAFDGILDDGEVRTVLAYIEASWPTEIRQMRAERMPAKN